MSLLGNKCNWYGRVKVIVLAVMSLVLSGYAFAKLDGAIFTTTPSGEIVNENVRYESKQEVFLDGGPGPNAPGSAAALPEGFYYFQVTNPSGKCLLSSIDSDAGVNGGSCYESVKGKGGPKNAVTFSAEPLECRLFYFDGEDGIQFQNPTYTVSQKIKGQWVDVEVPCSHMLGSEYIAENGGELSEGDTIQLFPFANTPNSGGVYKAWVATEQSVIDACGGEEYVSDGATGELCNHFFGFVPRFSKTDNFKVRLGDRDVPVTYDIALRSFHDKNLNCQYDPEGDELIKNWDFGVIDPLKIRNVFRTTNSEAFPITFSVLEQELAAWSVDQFMWFAQQNGVTPLNANYSHFATFAELRDYAPLHNDGSLRLDFVSPLACDQGQGVQVISRDTGEQTDDGFIPSNFADPVPGTKGEDPAPVLVASFGSVGIADITVCKVFDSNRNGVKDSGEHNIANWPVVLTVPKSVPLPDNINIDDTPVLWTKLVNIFGNDIAGMYNRTISKQTGSDGCVRFRALVPNIRGDLASYVLQEQLSQAQGWVNTSPHTVTFDVRSVLSYVNELPVIDGEVYKRDDGLTGGGFEFNNTCELIVNFDTKGYWHNKNGLSELTEADRVYVNGLAPYSSASAYFGSGDEPFDGLFSDNSPVSAAFSGDGVIWEAGTWQSEVSQFLVDNNGDAETHLHKEQLAQQLLAFLFNTRHRPDNSGLSGDVTLQVNGNWVSLSSLIDEAITVWLSNDVADIVAMSELLDGFNNNDALVVIPSTYSDCYAPFPE
ncbi:hypothetical protein LNL84_05365 [Vibrio sp. ZSDZ34]|uniref:Uncharacterized protein n=1 Tax=Vibrio gelatinilyticus TaxID=2893468 RepID=A0A9X1WD72_9VIBR|nr:hypothetical protein [Vibrio gelatinilyticus]MCJ2376260.1 hypothetical protein [Vibrio gelatinilyticus]